MFKIRSRKIVLPLLMLLLWTAAPARAYDGFPDGNEWSDLCTLIFEWVADKSRFPLPFSTSDVYIPKTPPPDGAAATGQSGDDGG